MHHVCEVFVRLVGNRVVYMRHIYIIYIAKYILYLKVIISQSNTVYLQYNIHYIFYLIMMYYNVTLTILRGLFYVTVHHLLELITDLQY